MTRFAAAAAAVAGPVLAFASLGALADSLEIRVVGPEGEKPARVAASVRVLADAAPGRWTWREARDGVLVIDGLEKGRPVAVRLRTEGSAVASTRAILPGPGAVASVKLRPGRSVFGIVVDRASGNPIAGATVVALTGGDPAPLVDPAVTASDGTFELVGVPESARSVRAESAPRPPLARGLRDDGPLRFALEPARASRTALRCDRAPVPGESWRLRVARPGASAEAAVDDSGAATVDGLSPGRYDVTLFRSSGSERWEWSYWVASIVVPIRSETTIALRNATFPGEVRARILSGGQPVEGARLRAFPIGVPHSPDVSALTDRDGEARLPGLPPTRTWIAIDGTLAGSFCDVPETGIVRESIEIPPGRATVKVLDATDGAPVPGVTVLLAHDDRPGIPDAVPAPAIAAASGDDGVARFERLPPGAYVAHVAETGAFLGSGRARLAVPPGAPAGEAEIRAARGGYAFGTALLDGLPRSGVRVAVFDGARGKKLEASSGPDGGFRVGPLAPGAHPLFAWHEDGVFSAGVLEARVSSAAESETAVDLVAGSSIDVRVTAAEPRSASRLRVETAPIAAPGSPPWTEFLTLSERNEFLSASALDTTGRKRVGPLPPGTYNVALVAPDGSKPVEKTIDVAPGSVATLVLALP